MENTVKHLFELITDLDQEDFEELVGFVQMQQTERARRIMGQRPFPDKSFLDNEERARYLRRGSVNFVCLAEAQAALFAKDEHYFLQWLSCVKLPAESLLCLKRGHGAKTIIDMGFDTSEADIKYGEGWLEKEDVF